MLLESVGGIREINLSYPHLADSIRDWVDRATKDVSAAAIPDVHASIGTTVGIARKENQDRGVVVRFSNPRAVSNSFTASVLCDGMGGMLDGGRCAELAVANFINSLIFDSLALSRQSLRSAVIAADRSVFDVYKGKGGTTLTAVVFSSAGSAWGASVGDSRIYAISESKKINQVSIDDTISGELKRIKGSQFTPGWPDAHSGKLAQFIGLGDALEPRLYDLDERETAAYLLCSDGAQQIAEDTFASVVTSAPSLSALTSRLIQLSNWCGGWDNSSVICMSSSARQNLAPSSRTIDALLEIWCCSVKLEILIPEKSLAVSENALTRPSASTQNFSQVKNLTTGLERAETKRSKFPRPRKVGTKGNRKKRQPERTPPDVHQQFNMEVIDRPFRREKDPISLDDEEQKAQTQASKFDVAPRNEK
jgi:serine/threonine protein phosphatase PrpC